MFLNPCAADLHQSKVCDCMLAEADICHNADFCGDTDVKFGCWWNLIVESHGKQHSVDTDGRKDEILKEGTGDKCPHLRQEIIFFS